MRKTIALAITAATTAGLAAFVPTAAGAATSCTVTAPATSCGADTAVTFTLTGGTLSINVPASKNLGSVTSSTTATTISGQLGNTTVTDTRGSVLGAYSVAVTSSNFTTGGASAVETILGPTVTAFSGAVTFVNPGPAPVTTTTGVAAAGLVPILTNAGFTGNSTATYSPTITIPIPATNAAGVYSGTITQTVS